MSVGYSLTKAGIDTHSGNLAANLRNCLDDIAKYKAWLDATVDADLTALGYTSGEVAVLKSAFTDLNKVRDIYYGVATQSSTYDFTTFAKQLLADS